MADDYKEYTIQAKRGIKGEAFFESLISDYALPHQVVGPKDLGIDYFCEWVHGDKPTGILFGVQVKTFAIAPDKFVSQGVNKGFNWLKEYKIQNPNLRIKESTLNYWRALGIPFYLFAVSDEGSSLRCFYKRFTPDLTEKDLGQSKIDFYSGFYEVNDGNRFLAFADTDKRIGGFARDLFIDYIRCSYYKGMITYMNPRKMGLEQFADTDDAVFVDLLEPYRESICTTFEKTGKYLAQCTRPDQPAPLARVAAFREAKRWPKKP